MSFLFTKIEWASSIDYFGMRIFLIVLLNANLNPENSSALISWMVGK